ncbi:aminotransferase class III-fold pyridoxal phosphate-dependent enzyme [Sulfitobacter sp.]|uniref:aminotransferase class III-fold pyridoxal phosphate-dependent enzyme n=1 Tax=Sulfitobacter sp. TaxID=1903071 RepID=UPI003003889F
MTSEWQSVLRTLWGIDAQLTKLPGEFDLNFMAETPHGDGFVLKVMRPDCDPGLVDLQISALRHIADRAHDLPFPSVIPTLSGDQMTMYNTSNGETRLLWVLERLPGQMFADALPKTDALIHNLGRVMGASDLALADFTDPGLTRDFKWDLMQAQWITPEISDVAKGPRRALLEGIAAAFDAILPALQHLPSQAIHNDVNDYNILVDGALSEPHHISGLIDLGDICAAPRVCNLAIAAAYLVLDAPDAERRLAALVAGYHSANPLTTAEIDLIWPLLQMRLAVSVVNSTLMARDTPNDPYVVISQAPAWRFLEETSIDPGLLRARLRTACDLPVTDAAPRILAFLDRERGNFAPVMGADLSDAPMGSLSVEHSVWPQNPFHLGQKEAARIGEEYEQDGQIWLGYYFEPRLIYAEPAFRNGPWLASDRRTVHLAVDAFAPAGTPIYAPMDATVHVIENRTGHLDYGGVVILAHDTPGGDRFYTLYGHLNPDVCKTLKSGQTIAKGTAFCTLGTPDQNGGWPPHIHFQMALTLDGLGDDWPGVGDPDENDLWRAICPNPAALLNLPDTKTDYVPTNKADVLASRKAHFGDNLVLSYSDPIMLVRGWQHHLFDEWGRPYLDAYNNVPHVGHAHPRIQAVAADQLKRMNSNTRYLHPAQTAFADKLLFKLPDQFDVCFFVNSGSEANELALRLARAHTGAKGMVTPDHGYHGNTTGAINLSAYKFNAKGGVGPSDWVELVEVADDYRGSFRRDDPDRAQKFADLVDGAIDRLSGKGIDLAGFIAETFPSVGGQIIPPKGYLQTVYAKIRAAGGVCIADEVQTGLGRLGDYYFGFEQQEVLPDIVVLGKPLGNGHPMGALLTTRAIADSFAKGPEFFSTFGGSTLSCRIGKEVLDIVDDEDLQANAQHQGDRLLAGLRALQDKHDCIGDVRGIGLFVGVDLVTDRANKSEATALATHVKNRMRDKRILLGTEGPRDNILKIRPPLTIQPDDVDMIITTLDMILHERF